MDNQNTPIMPVSNNVAVAAAAKVVAPPPPLPPQPPLENVDVPPVNGVSPPPQPPLETVNADHFNDQPKKILTFSIS